MFDFSATEFLVIALVALIVIGPRELPGLLRQFGQMVGKVRRMASEFQDQLNNAVEHSEIQEIKKEVGKIADDARIDVDYDPASDAEREIRDAVHGKPANDKPAEGKVADKKPAVHNPDYGNDPDNALVDFPSPEPEAAAPAAASQPKRSATGDNAVVREPSRPRTAGAPAKRLPVTTGATTTADSVAAAPANSDGKPTAAEG